LPLLTPFDFKTYVKTVGCIDDYLVVCIGFIDCWESKMLLFGLVDLIRLSLD